MSNSIKEHVKFSTYLYRNLQNNRTMIHKNLFVAVSIQVIVQLIQHFDKIYTSDVYILETMVSKQNLRIIVILFPCTLLYPVTLQIL